jgi:hypothetical protein
LINPSYFRSLPCEFLCKLRQEPSDWSFDNRVSTAIYNKMRGSFKDIQILKASWNPSILTKKRWKMIKKKDKKVDLFFVNTTQKGKVVSFVGDHKSKISKVKSVFLKANFFCHIVYFVSTEINYSFLFSNVFHFTKKFKRFFFVVFLFFLSYLEGKYNRSSFSP